MVDELTLVPFLTVSVPAGGWPAAELVELLVDVDDLLFELLARVELDEELVEDKDWKVMLSAVAAASPLEVPLLFDSFGRVPNAIKS